jgi:hypothetical protein
MILSTWNSSPMKHGVLENSPSVIFSAKLHGEFGDFPSPRKPRLQGMLPAILLKDDVLLIDAASMALVEASNGEKTWRALTVGTPKHSYEASDCNRMNSSK